MTVVLAEDGYGLLPVIEVDPARLEVFTCGRPRLDEFLRTKANFFHKSRLGSTWVVVHRDYESLVGYFTLSHDSLELESSEEMDLGLEDFAGIARFPAVTIGRLAVTQELHRTGVSVKVMSLAIGIIQGEEMPPSACRLVVVDADNEASVLRYYEKHGFVQSLWADKRARNHAGRGRRETVKMLRDILAPWPSN